MKTLVQLIREKNEHQGRAASLGLEAAATSPGDATFGTVEVDTVQLSNPDAPG